MQNSNYVDVSVGKVNYIQIYSKIESIHFLVCHVWLCEKKKSQIQELLNQQYIFNCRDAAIKSDI